MTFLQRLIFITIVFIVYILIYFYFRLRFLKPFGFKGRISKISDAFLFVLIVSPILSFLLFFSEGKDKDVIVTVAFFLFGVVFTLFPYSLTRDILQLSVKLWKKIRDRFITERKKELRQSQKKEKDISRRDFLVNSNYAIFTLTGFSGVFGYQEAFREPTVFHHDIFLENLPEEFNGFKIAQISDIHIGPVLKEPFLRAVVEKINQLEPDIVAVTGDMVDGSVKKLKKDVAPLKDLSPEYTTYFITGNHEYYSGVDEWMEEAENLGLKVLLNSSDVIKSKKRSAANIVIGGVPDHREGPGFGHEYNPVKALEAAKQGDVKILLAHQPISIEESVKAGAQLQLSGHTHGGQFFPWSLGVGLIYPYSAGLYYHNEKMWINVNRGTGFWGPPLRLGVPSEITLLTLKKKLV